MKYERNPVNQIKLPYDTIKAYDTSTKFDVELYSEKKLAEDVDNIAFFIMSQDDEEFTNVTDYSVSNGVVTFSIPKIKEGKYYPQIMDTKGKVYSSDNQTFIDVVYNKESRAMEVFPIIKDQIIAEVTPTIKQYVMDNKHQFSITGKQGVKGDKGDKGEQGERGYMGLRGKQGIQGVQGVQGEKGEQGERGYMGLRGKQGERGEQGVQGIQGEQGAVNFDEITPEQIEMLKGEDGQDGKDGTVDFNSLTPEQLHMLTPEFHLDDNGDLYYGVRGQL